MESLRLKIRENQFASNLERIEALNELSWILNRKETEAAISYAKEALQLSEKEEYSLGIAHAKKNIGVCETWFGNYEQALSANFAAKKLFEDLGDREQTAQVCYNLSIVFYYLDDSDNEMKYSYECLHLYGEIGNDKGVCEALNGLGLAFLKIGKAKKALKFFKMALEGVQKIEEHELETKILDSVGHAYLDLGKFDKAIEAAQNGLKICEKRSDDFHKSYLVVLLADSYFAMEELARAKQHIEDGLKIRRKIKFVVGEGICLEKYSKILYQLKELEEARVQTDLLLKFSVKNNQVELELSARTLLSQIFEDLGDLRNSMSELKKIIVLKEKVENDRALKRAMSLEAQLGLEIQQKESKSVEIEKAKADTRLMSEIGMLMTSTLDLDEALHILFAHVRKLMPVDSFGVRIIDFEKKKIIGRYEVDDNVRQKPIEIDMDDTNSLTNWCIRNQKEIFISKLSSEAERFGVDDSVNYGVGCQSALFQPLNVGGDILGVITVQAKLESVYTDYHNDILKSLSSYCSIAVQNATMFQRMEEKVLVRTEELLQQKDNVSLLNSIGQEITSCLSVDEITKKVYDLIHERIVADSFGIGMYNEMERGLDFEGFIEQGETLGFSRIYLYQDTLAVRCFTNNEPVWIRTEDELRALYGDDYEAIDGVFCRSVIYVPLVIGEQVIGVMTLQSIEAGVYNEDEYNFITNLASYIAIALNNAKSFENIEILSEIGQSISSISDLVELSSTLHSRVTELMDASIFVLMTYDSVSDIIRHEVGIESGTIVTSAFQYSSDKEDSLAAWCIRNEDILVLNNMDNLDQYVDREVEPYSGEMPESLVMIPLVFQSKIIGLFSVQSLQQDAYSREKVEILKNISNYLAASLNTFSSLDTMRLMGEIGKNVTSSFDLDRTLYYLFDRVKELISFDGFKIGFWNEEDKSVDMKINIVDGKPKKVRTIYIDEIESPLSWVVQRDSLLLINDLKVEYAAYTKVDMIFDENDPNSLMYMPLLFNNQLEGIVCVESKSSLAFSTQDAYLIKNIAAYAAIALRNARSFEEIEKANVDLAKSQQEYKNLFSQIADSIFIFDNKNFQFIDCNESVVADYGYSKDEILNMTPVDLHPEEEREMVVSALARENKGSTRGRYTHLTRDGKEKIVDVSSEQLIYMGREATISIVRDVTESVLFERQILEQNMELEKLSIVASNTSNVVLICSPEGKLEWANESFEKAYGATLEEWKAQTGEYLYSHSSKSNLKEMIDACVMTKSSVTYESEIENSNGEEKWFQTSLTPVYTNAGDLNKLVLIDSDITERKHHELLIENKNKDITDSINYASRIQNSMLPSSNKLSKFIPEGFILFKPRDIVSGDFYWVSKVSDDEVIVAAVDCTGHGVPGAFLTIIANNLLNQIVEVRGITEPGKILDELNVGFLSRFETTSKLGVHDSMDAAIVKIKTTETGAKVKYAGAFNSIYFGHSELTEVRGDRRSIGMSFDDEDFAQHEINLEMGDMIYMFSDGYADQIGGPKKKKMLKSRFKKKLEEVSSLPVELQKRTLDQHILDWQADQRQLDDILVIGIRI